MEGLRRWPRSDSAGGGRAPADGRVVHLVALKDLVAAGFTVLPTFGRPHMTIVLSGLDRVEPLLVALGPGSSNPHYAEMTRRRRG